MVQSLNAKPDFMTKGNSFTGGLSPSFGMMMVGEKAFEFYSERNQMDYIQIPYDQIDFVMIQVLRKGKLIRTFIIHTKGQGNYKFNSSEEGKLLKAMSKYLAPEQLQKPRSFVRRTKLMIDYYKNQKKSK